MIMFLIKGVFLILTKALYRITRSTPEMIILSLLSFVFVIVSWKLSMRLDRIKLKKEICGRHVVVLGGSSGLGLAMCKDLVEAGANVTIIARGTTRKGEGNPLKEASKKCISKRIISSQTVNYFKADASDYEQLKVALKNAYSSLGLPHWVINCAGVAVPGMIRDQLPQEENSMKPTAESQICANYYTSLNLVRVVTYLSNETLTSNEDGNNTYNEKASSPIYPARIIFTGSVLSVMSFVGYSAYSASKYAIKGLCDALHSELLPFNVKVHLCLPGSIYTDAFVKENEIKPNVTQIIEGKSVPKTPEDVSSRLLGGILNNRLYVTDNMFGEISRILGNGISPRPCHIAEIIAMPIVASVGQLIYLVIKNQTMQFAWKQ